MSEDAFLGFYGMNVRVDPLCVSIKKLSREGMDFIEINFFISPLEKWEREDVVDS